MAFFNWAAPLMHRYLDGRWGADHIATLAAAISPYVSSPHESPGGHLLDLGGGTGGLARRLADALDIHVTIVDPTPEMIARVPEHPGVTARLGSAEDIPVPDGHFDAALVSDALHHFQDPGAAIDEIRRAVRPGGGVIVLELDLRGWRRLLACAERIVGEPANFFTPEGLRSLMAERGVRGSTRGLGRWEYLFQGEVEAEAAAPPLSSGRPPSRYR